MELSSEDLKRYIDLTHKGSGRSDPSRAISSALWGFNTRSENTIATGGDDSKGYIFVARPDFCLSDANLSQHRILASLLSGAEDVRDDADPAYRILASQPGAIRSLLDRRSCFGNVTKVDMYGRATEVASTCSPLVDPYNTFIPILTNQAISLSGHQDSIANTKVSAEGAYGQQHILSDARSDNYGNFKLTLGVADVRGHFIATMFAYWFLYMALIRDARNTRYPANIVNHRIDYNTRIFHIGLNSNKSKVTGIYDAVACIPMGMNDGEMANYDRNVNTPESSNNLSIQFECVGGFKYDPISRVDFNRMVASSNFSMYVTESSDLATKGDDVPTAREMLEGRGMVRLASELERTLLEGRAYPRISAEMDMEWWVPIDLYHKVMTDHATLMSGKLINDPVGFGLNGGI